MIRLSNIPGRPLRAEHQRHVGAVDVGVDDADRGAALRAAPAPGSRRPWTCRRRPCPRTPRSCGVTSGMKSGRGGGGRPGPPWACPCAWPCAWRGRPARRRPPPIFTCTFVTPGQLADELAWPCCAAIALVAGGCPREGEREADVGVVDREVADEAERDDVLLAVRIRIRAARPALLLGRHTRDYTARSSGRNGNDFPFWAVAPPCVSRPAP